MLRDPVLVVVFDHLEVELATNELHVDFHLLSDDLFFQKLAHRLLHLRRQLSASFSKQLLSVLLFFLHLLCLIDSYETLLVDLDLGCHVDDLLGLLIELSRLLVHFPSL